MQQTPNVASDHQPTRDEVWKRFVIPTAKGLEGFAWRVAWFAVVIKILFFS